MIERPAFSLLQNDCDTIIKAGAWRRASRHIFGPARFDSLAGRREVSGKLRYLESGSRHNLVLTFLAFMSVCLVHLVMLYERGMAHGGALWSGGAHPPPRSHWCCWRRRGGPCQAA